MKIIEQGYEILKPKGVLQHIEQIGRVCYKSEDKITEGSASKFVNMLFNNGHYAMLEHYRFIIQIPRELYKNIIWYNPHYITMTFDNSRSRFIISFSARGIYELYLTINRFGDDYETLYQISDIIYQICEKHNCHEMFGNKWINVYNADNEKYNEIEVTDMSDYEKLHHNWMSVKFITDRGISHELVRHRDASFAQESTRYCDYSADGCTYIKPSYWKDGSQLMLNLEVQCQMDEEMYNKMKVLGAVPQERRAVLNNAIKTEIVVTATENEWNHIFDLRAIGTTGSPHPQMKALMLPLYEECMLHNGCIR